MPSSYTTSLRLTLPATGELTGTWGTTVNTGITELLDSAVAGTTTISTWGGAGVPYTLSNTDGAADEARKMFIVATGAPGEAKNVICPAVSKLYFFRNDTTGGFALTLKTSGGSGIAVPAGQYKVLYCNGTNVVEAFNSLASLTLGTALAASSGGTGQSTYTTGDLLYASGASALSKLGIGTNGQILTSTGTAPQWSTLSGVAVTTFSAGTTGFTPSTATSGAVTLGGTLATTNGGTGLTSFTSGGVVYASSSSALATGSALTFDGANLGVTSGVTTLNQTGNGSAVLVTGTTGSAVNNYISLNHSPGGGAYSYTAIQIAGADIFSAGGNLSSYGGSAIVNSPGSTGGIIFKNYNTEQMRLTSTGLGIGTSSPGYKLDVSASVTNQAIARLNNSDTNDGNGLYIKAGGVNAGKYALYVEDGSGTALLNLLASGNLGIGTSSPGARLDVQATGAGIQLKQNATGSATYYVMDNTVETGGKRWRFGYSGAAGIPLFSLYNQTDNVLAWAADSSGNLGIGTSSPSRKLDVQGVPLGVGGDGTGVLANFVNNTTAFNASPTAAISLWNRINSGGSTFPSAVVQAGKENATDGDYAGYLSLQTTNAAGVSLERARIDSSGNLGLGVTPSATSGSYKNFQTGGAVLMGISGGADLYLNGNATFNSGWRYIYNGFATRYSQNDVAGGAHTWFTAPSGTAGDAISFTQAMTLDSSGNLGIGTSSPGYRVDASGQVRALESGTGSGDGGFVASTAGANGNAGVLFQTNSASRWNLTTAGTNGANLRIYNYALASTIATFDASGNLGLGVTPSAWGSAAYKAIQNGQSAFMSRSGGSDCYILSNNYYDGTNFRYINTAAAAYYRQDSGAHAWLTAPSGTAGNAISFTQAMTLDASGNLGIGTTSPAAKLDVSSTTDVVSAIRTTGSAASAALLLSNGDGTTSAKYSYIRYLNNATSPQEWRIGTYNTDDFIWRNHTSGTNPLTLDTSGNLGLGVTPTTIVGASGANGSGFQTNSLTISSYAGVDQTYFATNAYTSSYVGGWTYRASAPATRYDQSTGIHAWYHSTGVPSAGGPISFTQAMTLDASGNLGVGTSSPSERLDVANTGAGSVFIRFRNSAASTGYVGYNGDALTFLTATTERARITSGGDLLVGDTSQPTSASNRLAVVGTRGIDVKSVGGATDVTATFWNNATTGDNIFLSLRTETTDTQRGSIDYDRAGGLTRYNTTSDYRAKDIIGPVQNVGATIDALKVYEGVMKGATQSRPMLIAHEAQQHAPYAVSGVKDEMNEDGTPKFQQIDVSSLVPLLLAEIQSLRARVAALESQP